MLPQLVEVEDEVNLEAKKLKIIESEKGGGLISEMGIYIYIYRMEWSGQASKEKKLKKCSE